MFRSILVLWVVTFLSVAATVYGRLAAKAFGVVLVATSVYAFFVPPIILAIGNPIP
jgi:hypothetical protein